MLCPLLHLEYILKSCQFNTSSHTGYNCSYFFTKRNYSQTRLCPPATRTLQSPGLKQQGPPWGLWHYILWTSMGQWWITSWDHCLEERCFFLTKWCKCSMFSISATFHDYILYGNIIEHFSWTIRKLGFHYNNYRDYMKMSLKFNGEKKKQNEPILNYLKKPT